MKEKQVMSSRDEYLLHFGDRLRKAIHGTLGNAAAKRTFERDMAKRLAIKPASFARWYRGENAPSFYVLSQLLSEINQHRAIGFDANYVLLDQKATSGDTDAHTQMLERIDKRVSRFQELLDQQRDRELGVEGLMERTIMALREELRAAGPAQAAFHSSNHPIVAGILQDQLIEVVERNATRLRLATLQLDYGNSSSPTEDPSDAADRTEDQREHLLESTDGRMGRRSGRFLEVVSENLLRETVCEYEFLLPESSNPVEVADKYKAALHQYGVPGPTVVDHVRFYKTSLPLGAGFGLYDLDCERLEEDNRRLFEQLKNEYLLDLDNSVMVLGEVMSPSPKMHACALMDQHRTKSAIAAWDGYMLHAEQVI